MESMLCPSAYADMADSHVFGLIAGIDHPAVIYLETPVPVTAEVIALAGEVAPEEVFRVAAACIGAGCGHFDGADCRLGERIVRILPAVTGALPACRIRASCRWFAQEGAAACLRCPQVITLHYSPDELMRRAA